MKTESICCGLLAATLSVSAEPPFPAQPPVAPVPPPVFKVPGPSPGSQVDYVVLADETPPVVKLPPATTTPAPAAAGPHEFVYRQNPVSGRPMLVTPEQAKAIVQRFKAAYPKLGNPRLLIFVNRELVDDQSGVKLSARTEHTRSAKGELTVAGTSIYRIQDPKTMSLADKQTVRDVERLFGRSFRLAGASLADQRVATELLGDSSATSLGMSGEGDRARKERKALTNIADVAIEVLISSQNVVVPEVSGDKTYTVPDIQATAIRLSDARILGQATASDITGKGQYAGWVAQHFDVHDIGEATALSLMEDMLLGVNPDVAADKK
jgi:hypothetical protein